MQNQMRRILNQVQDDKDSGIEFRRITAGFGDPAARKSC